MLPRVGSGGSAGGTEAGRGLGGVCEISPAARASSTPTGSRRARRTPPSGAEATQSILASMSLALSRATRPCSPSRKARWNEPRVESPTRLDGHDRRAARSAHSPRPHPGDARRQLPAQTEQDAAHSLLGLNPTGTLSNPRRSGRRPASITPSAALTGGLRLRSSRPPTTPVGESRFRGKAV